MTVPVFEEAIAVARGGGERPVRYAQASPAAVSGGVAHDLCLMMMYRDLKIAQRWAEEARCWAEREGYPPVIAADTALLGYVALLRGDQRQPSDS